MEGRKIVPLQRNNINIFNSAILYEIKYFIELEIFIFYFINLKNFYIAYYLLLHCMDTVFCYSYLLRFSTTDDSVVKERSGINIEGWCES